MRLRLRGLRLGLGLALTSAVAPLTLAQAPPQPTQQCVATAIATGTSDALQVSKLPCTPTTTVLVLQTSKANTTTSPTLQAVGQAAATIVEWGGVPLQVGELQPAQWNILTYNGANWIKLSPSVSPTPGLNAVSTNINLAAASTALYPLGVWRLQYSTLAGGSPTFWLPQSGTCAANDYPGTSTPMVNDGGTCVDSANGASWISQPSQGGLDVRQFGFASGATTAANRTALQAAINAAFHFNPSGSRVSIPIGASVDAYIYVPNNVELVCGGANQALVRASVGPLFVTVQAPGDTYAKDVTTGFAMQDCSIDNNELAGTGLVLHVASGWKLTRTSFRNTIAGAEFNASVAGTTMTVGHLTQGTIHQNDFVMGAGLDAILANTWPSVVSGSGPFELSANYVGGITSEEMIAVAPWTWVGGPPNPANSIFPSADVMLLGGVFDGQWSTGYVGGSYNPTFNSCAKTSAIGIYGDSDQQSGSGKPNFNLFQNIYNLCANAGLWISNGSNNTFVQIDHEFDNIDEVWGTGIANAFGNYVIQPYFEGVGAGAPSGDTRIAIIWDENAHDNFTLGAGSFDFVDVPAQNLGQRNFMSYTGRTSVGGLGVARGPAMAGDEALVWQQTGSGVAPVLGLSMGGAGVLQVGNGTQGDTGGTVSTTHFTAAGTAGVSCPAGINAGTFQSVNGIVTHC